MRKWSELKAAEKVKVIQVAIRKGVSDIQTIKDTFNFNNIYMQGGKIHIDPSKKGTFTAAASKHGKSVQTFASQVLAHKENYSSAMLKKANFAKNAAHWHQTGGPLYPFSFGPLPAIRYAEGGNKTEGSVWHKGANGLYLDTDANTRTYNDALDYFTQLGFKGKNASDLALQYAADNMQYDAGTLPEVTITPNVQKRIIIDNGTKNVHYAPHIAPVQESTESKIAAGMIGLPMLTTVGLSTIPAYAGVSNSVTLGETINFLGTQAGKNFVKKALLDLYKGTLGFEATNALSRGITGNTIGQNIANLTESIPYIQSIPYGVREFAGDFVNPGGVIGAKYLGPTLTNAARASSRALKNFANRNIEMLLRVGDEAGKKPFSSYAKQLFSKEGLKYAFGLDKTSAYRLPVRYSGMNTDFNDAHPGDMIDVFMGKSNVLKSKLGGVEGYFVENPVADDISKETLEAFQSLPGKEKVFPKILRFKDMAESPTPDLVYSEGITASRPIEITRAISPEIYFGYHEAARLIDPGHFGITATMRDGKAIRVFGEDVYHYTPKLYVKTNNTNNIMPFVFRHLPGFTFGHPFVAQWEYAPDKIFWRYDIK